MLNGVIRVLIVDDSAYMRKAVREMLSHNPYLEVVGAARDGKEALEMVEILRPDVVVSDLTMPELDGVGFVREQMHRRPLPIVVMSSLDENGAEAIAALSAGAVDFVQKPTALATEKIFEVRELLIEKIKTAAGVEPEKLRLRDGHKPAVKTAGFSNELRKNSIDVIVIGISTGGPQALRLMIPQLPADFPVPIAIVLHMPVGYTAMYAEKLNEISRLEVREAVAGDELRAGRVLLAPAGRHLTFTRNTGGKVVVHLDVRPLDMLHRPSVDVLFQSAAEIFRSRALGVVMTGMGSDGRNGAAWIKAQGGSVFTESEETSVVYGMPAVIAEAGLSDRIIRLDRMADALMEAA